LVGEWQCWPEEDKVVVEEVDGGEGMEGSGVEST
jgi:hypothetical protein